jgi:type IV pilus assembly protein PilV
MRVRQQAHEGGPWLDAGSTLVEILVSIIVMAIGILGLVGLQIFTVRHLREARLQTTAMTLATELAERMRGNPSVAARRDPSSNPYLRPRLRAAPTEVAIDCAVARCETPEQLATWDVVEWAGRLFSVESGLPDARVTICFDEQPFDADGLPIWHCTGTGDLLHIKLGWRRESTDRSRTGAAAFDRVDDADSRPAISVPVLTGTMS